MFRCCQLLGQGIISPDAFEPIPDFLHCTPRSHGRACNRFPGTLDVTNALGRPRNARLFGICIGLLRNGFGLPGVAQVLRGLDLFVGLYRQVVHCFAQAQRCAQRVFAQGGKILGGFFQRLSCHALHVNGNLRKLLQVGAGHPSGAGHGSQRIARLACCFAKALAHGFGHAVHLVNRHPSRVAGVGDGHAKRLLLLVARAHGGTQSHKRTHRQRDRVDHAQQRCG